MQCSFNQTPATFSQVQSPQSPTIAQSFSTQTQTYMKPCSTQTILASTQNYGTPISEHGKLPLLQVPVDASTRQTSFIQVMHKNIGTYRDAGTISNNTKAGPYLWPPGECTSCNAFMEFTNSF